MYIADLHIHSRYSRATSRDCTPESLDLWARRKGIGLVGTGDFTHPAWRGELREKLKPAEEGFYTLKREYRLPEASLLALSKPRFVVTGEISSIYKKNGKVRKVHNVILLPSLEDAERISMKLETIGNIHSDGRPILGLDCRDLLEIVLELCPRAMLVPAHIWTPHFSLFGAFSGFDTIEECFEDLTPHIRALETGLSSDPEMNWRLSALDSFQLISNSDAHSPSKLGREANLIDGALSYDGLYDAVQNGRGLAGTIEFFPEEGKYHFDGHRKCHLCLSPQEAEAYKGICPVCGRKLTIGVSHRVNQLADREEGYRVPEAKPFESMVPLPEVLAASMGTSAASVKVQREYLRMLKKLGPEFSVLREIPVEDIRRVSGSMAAEGIRRLREGRVERIPGYDGEYGIIRLFTREELSALDGQMSLFTEAQLEAFSGKQGQEQPVLPAPAQEEGAEPETVPQRTEVLNERQSEAVRAVERVVAVEAGPGTGKTKTLAAHAQYLLSHRRVKSSEITAVTFTKKAAAEMKERLLAALGSKRSFSKMRIGTFHSICYDLLKEQGHPYSLADEIQTVRIAEGVIKDCGLKISPKRFLSYVSGKKSGTVQEEGQEELQAAYEAYQSRLWEHQLLDFDDLLLETLYWLKEEKKQEIRRQNFSYLLVDEFQDISPVQYALVKALNQGGKELFVIGDPDQAIYGFRGADSRCFERLWEDFPDVRTIRLEENYRCTQEIVEGALSVISHNPGEPRTMEAKRGTGAPIRLITASGDMAEAIFTAKEISRMVGGIDMLDAEEWEERPRVRSFQEIAVLYRTHRQAALLEKCLKMEGIPYTVSGREAFLDEKPVRSAVCFFRCLLMPEEKYLKEQSMEAMQLSEEEFEKTALRYGKKVKKEKPYKLLTAWMEEMGLAGDEAMIKLISMSMCYPDMNSFLDALIFGQECDLKRCGTKTYTPDAVTLMTLHGAKGLEFPAVILYGVKEGTLPLKTAGGGTDAEEERRLFYVGMTRAGEELILTTSSPHSSFLEEIPGHTLRREKTGKQKLIETSKQMNLFDFI